MKESLLVLLYASILSVFVGVFLGVVMGRFSIVEWATDIYVSALYSMPMVAMVPLIVLWFGFKVPAKVIIVFLFMVFPILLNTYQGVKDVDRNLQEVARSFCSSEGQLWRHLIIPSAIPFIVVGVRLAIGRGLVGMIVAEFYTSVTGLGYMIVRYANAFETDKLFVPIVVVMVLGVGLMWLAKWVEGRIAPWRNFDEGIENKEACMKKALFVLIGSWALALAHARRSPDQTQSCVWRSGHAAQCRAHSTVYRQGNGISSARKTSKWSSSPLKAAHKPCEEAWPAGSISPAPAPIRRLSPLPEAPEQKCLALTHISFRNRCWFRVTSKAAKN